MLFFKRLFFLLMPLFLNAQDFPSSQADPEIGITEKLNQYVPEDIELINESGNQVTTGQLFGRPTVLNLVYYRCPGICSPLMNGLAEVIRKTDMQIGTDYQVITVSFSPTEGPDLARQKKRNYLSVTGLEEAREGWLFFTSDSLNIARLTESVGFRYKKTGFDYLHSGTLIFIAADGKITRYLNGISFLPFEFKMALIETSRGQSAPTLNKVLQFCYSYDPQGQQYVLNITRVAGIMIMFILLLFFSTLVIWSLAKKRRQTVH